MSLNCQDKLAKIANWDCNLSLNNIWYFKMGCKSAMARAQYLNMMSYLNQIV